MEQMRVNLFHMRGDGGLIMKERRETTRSAKLVSQMTLGMWCGGVVIHGDDEDPIQRYIKGVDIVRMSNVSRREDKDVITVQLWYDSLRGHCVKKREGFRTMSLRRRSDSFTMELYAVSME